MRPREQVVHRHDDLVGVDGAVVLAERCEQARAMDHPAARRRRDAELPRGREFSPCERGLVQAAETRHPSQHAVVVVGE